MDRAYGQSGTDQSIDTMKKTTATILIVDDDPNDLMFIRSAFKAVGTTSTIHTVDGGVEAIAYLKGEGKYSDRTTFAYPDFLITDLKMPEVDGFGVLEFLKSDLGSPLVWSAILSGSVDDDDVRKACWLGACSYHVKPSSSSALRVLVKALHDYWMLCEFPEANGGVSEPDSDTFRKLGARFAHSVPEPARSH
jgi:CheY-like chemotaxis protein